MGLPTIFHYFNWPAIVSGALNIGSSFSLVLLSKICLTPLAFSFPATLALLHTATIALCLWFWTIFGMLKPLRMPIAPILSHAIPTAISDVLALVALHRNSLSIFHASRLAIPPAVILMDAGYAACWSSELRQSRNSSGSWRIRPQGSGVVGTSHTYRRPLSAAAAVCFAATAVITTDQTLSASGALVAVTAVIATAASNWATLPGRRRINANELQFQLFSKSISTVVIAFMVPLVDDVSPSSPSSLLQYEFPESYSLHIFFTGLLAFLSFTSMRTSATRSAPFFYTIQTLTVSALIFTADRTLLIPNFIIPPMWLLSVVSLILSTAFFSVVRDLDRDEGCGTYQDEESAAIELQRQQREEYHISFPPAREPIRVRDPLTQRNQVARDYRDTHPISRQTTSTRQRLCRACSQSPVRRSVGPVALLRYASSAAIEARPKLGQDNL